MNQFDPASKPSSPLAPIVVTSFVLGLMGYLMVSVAGESGPTAFLQFAAALATLVYLLTFINIRLGLGILILCIGLSPEVEVAGLSNLRFEDFLVPALLAAWLLRNLRSHEEFAPSPIKASMLLYVGVMVLSAMAGAAGGTVKPTITLLIVGKNLVYFLIFYIFLNNIRTYAEFKAFVIFALLVSFAGAITSLGTSRLVPETQTGRVQGPLGETANIFGGYLIMHIAILLSLFFHLPGMRGRVASLVGAGVLFYTLMFTYSRTSYVALLVSIATFAILKQRRLIVAFLILIVTFPLLAPESVLYRFVTILSIFSGPGPESWQARVISWEENMDRIFSHPLLGGGPGSIPFGDVDNEYVRVAIDMGIPALAILVWMLLVLLVTGFRLYDRIAAPGFLKGFAGGYFMLLIAILVHAGGATSFSTIRTMEAFMVITALMCVLHNRYDEWKDEEERAVAMEAGSHALAAVHKP
ncbi:MAG: O-antigen ligase family protein [Planctomycetes bacterium]|nr:O-antigen ligase family protein [Planctomycetota bacterium]